MGNWKSASHNKYLLQYHLIFVCKYRKKLLINQYIANDIKRLSREICSNHNVSIKYMEVDKDHIHYDRNQTKHKLIRFC
jgi:putative transposase